MKNKSCKKHIIFLITCLAIIAIGICLPIVGTTLASNDTTKASPVASNASTIETSSKIDKNAQKISLSYKMDGDYLLDDKSLNTYKPNEALTIEYENCFDANYYTSNKIPGVENLPRAYIRKIISGENTLDRYTNNGSAIGFSVFGKNNYRFTIKFDFGKILNDSDVKSTKTVATSDVSIRFLNSNSNYIYTPAQLAIKGSIDGIAFYDWGGQKVIKETKYNGYSIQEWTFSRDTFANVRYLNIVITQYGQKHVSFDSVNIMTRAKVSEKSDDMMKCWSHYSNYIIDNLPTDAIFNNHLVKFQKGSFEECAHTQVVNKGSYGAGVCPNGMLQSIVSKSGTYSNKNYDQYVITESTFDQYNYTTVASTNIKHQILLLSNGSYGVINSIGKLNSNIVMPDYIVGKYKLTQNDKTKLNGYNVGTPIVEIGSKAFANKGRINSLTIGRNIHTIASDAFTGTQITNIYIDPANVTYYVKNNTLYDKNNKVIYKGTASTGGAIAEPSKSVNELIKKAGYLVDIAGNEKLLRNIKPCTLISDFVAQFNGKQIKINGVLTTKLKDNYIKTGDKLTIDGLQFIALVWGDGNGDGKVNAADYILARRLILNMVELNTYQTRALCVTGTSKITTADYIKIRKYIMGEITL